MVGHEKTQRLVALAAPPLESPADRRACKDCREARPSGECACCSAHTAVIAVADAQCIVEYCGTCWALLQAVRMGPPLQSWTLAEYVQLQQEHADTADKRHRTPQRKKAAPITEPVGLPWNEEPGKGAA